MAKKTVTAPPEESGTTRGDAERLISVISRNVMTALGRPGDFLRVTVRPVTEDSYRVNVMTGADASSTRVAHSFYVTADKEGNVTGSSPTIEKHY